MTTSKIYSLIQNSYNYYYKYPTPGDTSKIMKNMYRKGLKNPSTFMLEKAKFLKSDELRRLEEGFQNKIPSFFNGIAEYRAVRELKNEIKPMKIQLESEFKRLYPKTRKLRLKIIKKLAKVHAQASSK